MTLSPGVTIGIPCYNGARWVGQAVESALRQTLAEKEVVVIDDGSTDGSRSVLEEFGDSIRLVSTQNRGVNVARNLIIEMARGAWIQYLDADDYMLPDKLSRQFAEVEGLGKIDVVYSPVYFEYWDSDGCPLPLIESVIDLSTDIYAQWIGWQLPQTSGALWRKASIEKLGGWNPERDLICDEHELYLRAIQAGFYFQFAPSANAVYRVWSSRTRSHAQPESLISHKSRLIIEMQHWLLQRGLWTSCHERIAGQACFEMCRTLASHDLRAASRLFRQFRSRNLIALSGPAAPQRYQRTYNAVGFVGAELLAHWFRAFRPMIGTIGMTADR